MMGNASTSQLNEWPAQQNDANPGVYASQSFGSTNLANSDPTQQNQIGSASQYTSYPAPFSPSQGMENLGDPDISMGHNGVSSDFNGASSPTRHVGAQGSRDSSDSNTNENRRSSKPRDKAPFRWRPGMKERKITDDMTPEEKKEASDWNYKYSEAKKAHTREQNRVSAQKSRQKKVELLERTRTQVEDLEDENARLQSHVAGLEAAIQQISNENMHLQNQNEILRQRVTLLEQQIQAQPVRNPHAALVNQNQTPAVTPGVQQPQQFLQAPTPQNPAPVMNGAQTQGGLEFGLGSTQTLAGNGPVDPTTLQPQQQQQSDNATHESRDDFIVDWMSMADFPQNSDPNSRPWSPSNGGAQ
ncbi:uncharacterized protein GGS22DRAFT_150972 [Annulohypoxylon maeteangense]|uniref:uncharacterized protein n=1 Tax=Annulohypoxylon maeteangense TaxID=1927788 RepID=UPI00200876AE|nr:uncharacterized protein GGS22DRAFT_150972 [Annulohypoxylon maeteangense]KAI0890464.1 hypothetical protein GGS22DRAFT_150972 [Annulohypoxylon maeteangense]